MSLPMPWPDLALLMLAPLAGWLPQIVVLLLLAGGAGLLLHRERTVALLVWAAVTVLLLRIGASLVLEVVRQVYVLQVWTASPAGPLWMSVGRTAIDALLAATGLGLLLAATFRGRRPGD